ncbi:MAG: sodium:solute symporter [Bradymonadia bacterium]
MGSIETVDYIVIGVYFAVVFTIGLTIARKTHSGEDLFLAGRTLGFAAIGFSLFASNISSTSLIGLSGAAYKSGIAVSAYEWMAAVVLIFMAAIFIPLYLKARITTVPEFLEKRFDRRSRVYFSLITIFLSIVVDTAGGLYAGALVLKVFFPDLVVWQTCVVLALIAGLYTAAGGLAAVVYTDVIQAVVLLMGTALLTYYVLDAYDFSWAAATAATPDAHMHLIRGNDDPDMPWLGLITGVPILGFWYWTTNQYITQRVLGARSVAHARWGAILGGLLKLVPLFTMILPGALAIGLYPDLQDPDLVFPTLVTELLPAGVVGLVLAGLIAAIMSSVDSTLNSASALVVCDFIGAKQSLTPKAVAKAGRLTTLILMVVAAAWAPMIEEFGGLFDYIQKSYAILVPPIATIFLLGAFWRRGTGTAALTTLVVGHGVGLVFMVLSEQKIWNAHFTITCALMTAVSIVVFVMVSLQTAPTPKAQLADSLWQPEMARPTKGATGWRDYRVLSALLAALTLWMVASFW